MIYLDIPNVKGSVTAKGFEGSILISNYMTEADIPVNQRAGSAGSRELGLLAYQPLIMNKSMDKSSAGLLNYFHAAKVIPQMSFNHVTTGAQQSYLRSTFSDVVFARYEEMADTDGIIETYRLYFTKVEKRYSPTGADGKIGSPITTGYNLISASKL